MPRTQLNIGHSALLVTRWAARNDPDGDTLTYIEVQQLIDQSEFIVTAAFGGESFVVATDDDVLARHSVAWTQPQS